MHMRTNLLAIVVASALLVAPVLALADHNDGHTIEQLQAKVKELSAQIDALRAKLRPVTAPPAVEPIRPIVIPPVFDDDRSDDEIVQLNNLRIQSVSGSEFPVVISAYHDFGVRCLKFQSQDAPSGISIPCPVPPSVLYQIRVDSGTLLLLRNRVRTKISNFEVGDRINVYGFMDRDSNAVDALIVRNLDKPVVKQFIQLNNVEVVSLPSSPTPPATLVVMERHRFPCFDFGEFGRGKGEPFPCPLGADEVRPGTGSSGGAGGVSTPSLYPPIPIQRKYEIRVNSNTQILDGRRTPMSLGAIEVGDVLNVYGTYSRDTHVINALILRDLSKPKVSAGILRVTVTSSDAVCIQGLGNKGAAETVIFPGFECEILYNASVGVERGGAMVAKGSTEKGFALFENLEPGHYALRAAAPGYQEGKSEIDIQAGGEHVLTIALEQITERKISIESLSELRGAVGRDFRATFEASGGAPSYTWEVTGGSFPPGLELMSPPLPLSVAPCYIGSGGQSVCPDFRQTTVWLTGVPTQAGTYKFELTATDSRGNRGSATFVAVITETQANRPPVIHGVSGPVVLEVSETGTWTVKASDPENQPLSYSVIWGDETVASALQSAPREIGIVQDATFTHAYARPGAYTPTFTVTDSTGLSAKTSISVKVVEEGMAVIRVLFPNGGEVWQVGQTYSIKWNSSGIPNNASIKIGYYSSNLQEGLAQIAVVPNTGYYSWTIPNTQQSRNDYRIGIEYRVDPNTEAVTVADQSDAPFSIVAEIGEPTPIPGPTP